MSFSTMVCPDSHVAVHSWMMLFAEKYAALPHSLKTDSPDTPCNTCCEWSELLITFVQAYVLDLCDHKKSRKRDQKFISKIDRIDRI